MGSDPIFQTLMQCGRFDMDAAQTKRWIVEQIIK